MLWMAQSYLKSMYMNAFLLAAQTQELETFSNP